MSLVVACGNNNNNNTPTADNIENVKIDTVKVDTIAIQREAAKTRDSLPGNCTAQQAIEYMKSSGYWDKYSAGILPDIVEQHLPYARQLINNTHDYFIIVDKGSMMVILYDKYGCQKLSYKMACGKNYGHKRKKADCRTPEGFFRCGGVFNSTDWLYTNDYGVTSPVRGQFGPRFIRVCPQIGIHGTGARYSIGRRCSHGCIRIQNENIMILHKYAEKGMPIIVNPGPNDAKVNKQNGVYMPMLSIPNLPAVQAQAIEAENEAAKIRKEKAATDTTTSKASTKTDTTKSVPAAEQQGEKQNIDTTTSSEGTVTTQPTEQPEEIKQETPAKPKADAPKEQPNAQSEPNVQPSQPTAPATPATTTPTTPSAE